jgi:hypothetical protein
VTYDEWSAGGTKNLEWGRMKHEGVCCTYYRTLSTLHRESEGNHECDDERCHCTCDIDKVRITKGHADLYGWKKKRTSKMHVQNH